MIKVLLAIIAALSLACGYLTYQWRMAEFDAQTFDFELGLCGQRLNGILEDIRSDEQASELLDDLSSVPPEWLR